MDASQFCYVDCNRHQLGSRNILLYVEQAAFRSHLDTAQLDHPYSLVTDSAQITVIRTISTGLAIISILHFYKPSKNVLQHRGAYKQLVCFKMLVFLNFLQTVSTPESSKNVAMP
jgi:hypothetical protein